MWGNEEVAASAALLILFNAVIYPTIAALAIFLDKAASSAELICGLPVF